MKRAIAGGMTCWGMMALVAASCNAAVYSNGFDIDNVDWTGATRVASGSNGISSAEGSFHAEVSAGAFTRWGGYNFGAGSVPTNFAEYRTSIDIFLDVNGGFANNTRFDFSSAISNSVGGFQRDFIFNAGFYDDGTGPGAGTPRFVISASNNSQPGSAFAKNPARDPIAIGATGWYTFEHHFYDDGGVLAVDMTIRDALDAVIHTWTLSNPLDLIAGIGGNRYGWFDYSEFPFLAIDNPEMSLEPEAVPEPASLALWGCGVVGAGLVARRRRAVC